MKVTFLKEDLAKALDTVQRAAQNKITSNTNNGIFISAASGTVTFMANDYTIGIKTECAAQIIEEGDVVVAAPQLPTMIRLLPPGDIVLEQKTGEGTVSFTAGQSIYRFPVRSADEFPLVETMQHPNHCEVRCADLAEMVSLTQYAASSDKQKPIFSGILLELNNSSFAMAATNTHRLAAKEITLETPAEVPGRMIAAANVMSEVVRLLPQEEGAKVEISWAKNHIAFAFGKTYFVSTLINGEYPDYHRVIPKNFTSTAVLDLRAFREAVSIVSPISRDMSYKTINFDFEEGSLSIYEEDKTIGSSRTVIPCQLTGEPIHIIFNCFYIEDILKHSTGDTIILHLIKNGPMLVEQEEDKTYQYVVTPMRGR